MLVSATFHLFVAAQMACWECSPRGDGTSDTGGWCHSSHTHLLYCACSAQIHRHISSVVELHHYVPLDHCLLFLPVHTETVPVFMMHHKLLAAAYILDVEVISLISLRCNCIRFNFPSLNPVYVVHLLKQLFFHHLQTYCSCRAKILSLNHPVSQSRLAGGLKIVLL